MPANYLEEDEELYPRYRKPGDPEDDETGASFDVGSTAEAPPVAAMGPTLPQPSPELRSILSSGRPALSPNDAPVVQDATTARNKYAEAVAAKPAMPQPKWWQRALAGAAGAAAGWSNAAGRTKHPIDIAAMGKAITAPGYDRSLSQWQDKVVAADAANTAAQGNEAAWWKNRQLGNQEEREQAQSERDKAMAGYESQRNATSERARKAANDERLEAQLIKPWGEDAQLQKESDPVPPGMETTRSITQPGMVYVHPPRFVKLADDLAPYATGRKPGDVVPYSEFKRAQATAAKDTVQQNKPVTPPADNVERVLLNPGAHSPEQVKAAQAMFDKMHRPPAAGQIANALPPDAVDFQARKYLQSGQMPTGLRNPTLSARILTRAAQIAKEQGQDPEATGLAAAAFKASSSALTHIEQQRNQVLAFEHNASANLDLADKVSQQVDRTGSPLINKYLLSLKGQVAGDTDTIKLKNAVTTAASEYAKVISGGSGNVAASDSVRKEAEEMLNASFSKGTFTAVIAQMKQEMQNRRNGFDQQVEELHQTLGQRQGQSPAQSPAQNAPASGGGRGAPPNAAGPKPSADFAVSYNGKTYHFPNQRAADGFKQEVGIR